MAGIGDPSKVYWNRFYNKPPSMLRLVPSQFAVFIQNEIEPDSEIVDIGCGTGRDGVFFAHHGRNVTFVDQSENAIKQCVDAIEASGLKAEYLCCSVESPELTALSAKRGPLPRCVYARFFLHAISADQEDAFLGVADAICNRRGDVLALEFRTTRDANLNKVTPNHYRRFVSTLDFFNKINGKDYDIKYFVEGFGFAKYKDDDAHVARIVLSKRRST